MRVLCLWLPNWPAQRAHAAASADSGRPVVVHHPVRNLPRVVALNRAAAGQGVTCGMPLAEAEALLFQDGPLLSPLDAAADGEELKRLAVLCGRFGPAAGLEEAERPESILIDVTGCDPLFGGEPGLVRQAVGFLLKYGYFARGGLADTVGQAWAASRVIGRRVTVVPHGDGEHWLATRPVAALRLDSTTLDLLDRLGLRLVGDVRSLPQSELPSRFGPTLLRRIGQAIGSVPEPVEPVCPPTPLAVRWSGETPLTSRTAVTTVLRWLLERLLCRLPVWEGVAGLTCRFGGAPPVRVGVASPSRSARRLDSLLGLALEREPPPSEVDHISLAAEAVRLPPPGRTSLFGDRTAAEQGRAFRRLVERLTGRFGETAVTRPIATNGHLPEHATRSLPAIGVVPSSAATKPKNIAAAATRPILLLPEPEPVEVIAVYPDGPPRRLTRRGRMRVLSLALGPERLETAWAADPEARRDYWRVETDDAERLWLYRCRRSGDWFLHGVFG